MKLTKKDVQKRVLRDGKPLSLKLFDWDEDSRTFESKANALVLDFTNIENVKFITTNNCSFITGSKCTFETEYDCVFNTGNRCVFKTSSVCTFKTGYKCTFDTSDSCIFNTGNDCMFVSGSLCTFTTGSDCTFDTSSGCVFKTGSRCKFKTLNSCTFDTGLSCSFITKNNCTFDTGSDCVFDTCNDCIFITNHSCNFHTGHKCVIITKTKNEVIKPESGVKLTTCSLFVPGYLIGNDYYVNGVKQAGKYMLADGILSKIISKIGDVYKVYNYTNYTDVFSEIPEYIVQDGDIFSHGETIQEARESLIYKISNRDKSVYENLTIDSTLTKEEAIRVYRVITGACEFGVRDYVASLTNVKDLYTVREVIELTNGLYGNEVLRDFFKI